MGVDVEPASKKDPEAWSRVKKKVPGAPMAQGEGKCPLPPPYALPPHTPSHSPLQLALFLGLQFDPKGKEESICAENWNESDFN